MKELYGLKIIDDILTADLVRVVHCLARTEPSDAEMETAAKQMAPFSQNDQKSRVAWWTEAEPELGIWHAWFVWPSRGMIRYVRNGRRIRGAVWWLYPGERLREAVEQAGTMYCLATGDWPQICYVRRRDARWPESVAIDDELIELRILEAPQMPAGFVLLV